MCGQVKFEVRDNVATFAGTIELCCLPRVGLRTGDPDLTRKVRDYATRVLTNYLRLSRYQVGEGKVTAERYGDSFGGFKVHASIFAGGPDGDLRLYVWGMGSGSAWAKVPSMQADDFFVRRSASG